MKTIICLYIGFIIVVTYSSFCILFFLKTTFFVSISLMDNKEQLKDQIINGVDNLIHSELKKKAIVQKILEDYKGSVEKIAIIIHQLNTLPDSEVKSTCIGALLEHLDNDDSYTKALEELINSFDHSV